MRARTSTTMATTLALLLMACGGKEKAPATPAGSSAAAPPAAPAAAPGGPVVDIRMTGNGISTATFEPDHVTIAPGTTLHFINVSGGPHNFSLWPDSIPTGAAAIVATAMTDTVGYLQSSLLTTPDQTLDVSFAGAPAGEYKGYCLPHLALGMRIWITVK